MSIFKKLDYFLLLPVLVIFALGALVIFSVAPDFINNQLVFFLFGLFVFFIVSNIDYQVFQKFSFWLYLLGLVLLVITLLMGTQIRGSTRWLMIGKYGIQTSEFVKPLLILYFANLLSSFNHSNIKQYFLFILQLLLPMYLIIKQPDLGSGLVIGLVGIAVLVSAGIKWLYLLTPLVASISVFPFLWRILKDYQKKRITSFLNPDLDPLKSGYNLIQAVIAIGSGGLLGKGLGEGTQSQLRYLPERHTDFIFASLAEELGLFGAIILLIAYLILLLKILSIAKKSTDKFAYLVCLGTFALLIIQTTINIGMNLSLMPITGITLPFVSSGGSSLISFFISLGLVQNISAAAKKREVFEIR